MKKMKTLFKREFIKKGKRTIKIITHNEIEEGCEWILDGPVKAYRKIDGTCCLVENDKIFKRFDLKPGRKLPEGAIPCQDESDCVTGHFPHWVECKRDNPDDKYFMAAFKRLKSYIYKNGTYELVGEKINGNKDKLCEIGNILIKHDCESLLIENPPRCFDSIKHYLKNNKIEGIVFYRESGEMCKIKRSDFGFEW